MYWPAGGRGSSTEFGGIHVTLLYEDVRAAYTVRHLRVRSTTQIVSLFVSLLIYFSIPRDISEVICGQLARFVLTRKFNLIIKSLYTDHVSFAKFI